MTDLWNHLLCGIVHNRHTQRRVGRTREENAERIHYLPPFPGIPLGSCVLDRRLEVISRTSQTSQRSEGTGRIIPLPCGHLISELSSLITLASLAPTLLSGFCHQNTTQQSKMQLEINKRFSVGPLSWGSHQGKAGQMGSGVINLLGFSLAYSMLKLPHYSASHKLPKP